MNQLTEILYNYAIAGDFKNFFIQMFNFYMPFGMFFWIFGFVVFAVLQIRTENYNFAGAVAAIYFVIIGSSGLVVSSFAAQAMQYFGLVLGVTVGYSIYRAIMDK